MLLAFLAVQRDIRYFVDIAAFPVIFAAAKAVAFYKSTLSRLLEILLVLFAVVFLTMGSVVGYEINSGVAEASNFVLEQNIPHNQVLVNYGINYVAFASLLPGSTIVPVPNNATQLSAVLETGKYNLFIVVNQARTTSYPETFYSILASHYQHHVRFGLSDFSYSTVFYNSTA